MHGTGCSVAICKSNMIKAKIAGEKIMFFNFPKNAEVRNKWIRCCHRKDKWNPSTSRICSVHFTNDDYEDSLKANLMNITPKKLKTTGK